MRSIKKILSERDPEKGKYVKHEFQAFGYELARTLNDLKHKSLYIKLAKEEDRKLLEKARDFVKGASNVDDKGKLFMWKLTQLREARKDA